MRASLIILFALFSNFFGWFIIEEYARKTNLDRPFIFQSEYMFSSVINTLIIIFTVACISFALLCLKRRPAYANVTLVDTSFIVPALHVTFLCLAVYHIVTINYSLNISGRGIGQFNRGLFAALKQVKILFLPLFLYYRLSFGHLKSVRIISLIFVAAITLQVMSYGDRRLSIYFLVAYIFIINNRGVENDVNIRKGLIRRCLVAVLFIVILAGAYSFRLNINESQLLDTAQHLTYSLMSGTIGALGTGAILAEVKTYVETTTGLLHGAMFINYFSNLFFPSFFRELMGQGMLTARSSLLFNNLFNDNPNQGYDFMMVADFYWNFGFWGYFYYCVLTAVILNFILKHENSADPFKFGLAILLATYFIAGQRSDFGFFLKSFVYSGVFYALLFKFSQTYQIRIKNK